MAGRKPTAAQGFSTRQPTLDFIDTRLPEYHAAFANPQVRFNTALGRYAPVRQRAQNSNMAQQADDQQLDLLPEQPPPCGPNPARRPFWDEMFPQAMAQLGAVRDEPTGLVGTAYSIRGATGWPVIVNTVEVARAKYYNYSGFIGFWKKAGHKMGDHATDAKTLLSLLPDSEYTSLIHCVFDVIFDAAKRTAEIRNEVEESLRQLREKFEDVESVVAIYSADKGTRDAALNVLVSVLQALEDIVLYYSAKRGLKMTATILWKKDDYKADLSECLGEIDSSSKKLLEKATLESFRQISAVNIKASEGLEKLEELQSGQDKMVEEQKRLADGQEKMAESGREIVVKQRELATGLSREVSANERNAAANERNAAANEAFALISATAMNNFNLLAQEYLFAKKEKERVDRLNAQLMVKNARLSTELREERSRSRGRYPAPEPVSQEQLLEMLNLPVDGKETDLARISGSAVLVDRRDQGRAEQLIANPQFRQWMVEPRSTELLVHGHMKPSRTSVSPLSLFTAAILQNLQQVDRFCTLAFFCGEHIDTEDPLAGGVGLIKSFMAQLLNQYSFDSADLALATRNVDLEELESGVEDVQQLCGLFVGLVRRLRSNVTLFCVLDSVNVYEDPRFMQEMEVERVLFEVLSLTRDSKVQTHVKILMTSPTSTATIRNAFEETDILSMVGQPKGDKSFDYGRVAQKLEGALR